MKKTGAPMLLFFPWKEPPKKVMDTIMGIIAQSVREFSHQF
jgi:hypothetical protein